ncbi:DUF2339 domain-containing protein [Saccharospirillum impatiens]|uniref:DUF2339 domain-containing protein n=1 Tax=Saccharospirillum impatiens TaxID=169438 RepID=UPI000413E6B6|nr:DUF2339 domain-containing protein [Saccharospirillum impatiens]
MGLWVLLIAGLVYLLVRIRRLEKTVRSLELRLQISPDESPTSAIERENTTQSSPQSESVSESAEVAWQAVAATDTPSEPAIRADQPQPSAESPALEPEDHSWQPAPPRPREPSFLDTAFDRIKRYFTEGNLIVRVGIIVLFFGVAFLLRYANAQGALPMGLKVFFVAALGVILLGIGWRLRQSRGIYALVLQGGGMGILYITAFTALRLFQLVPASVGFALLLVMVVLAAALAVMQNAPALAIMAVTGGFLAPVLASTGQGSHIALFSYYALLNAGILGVAWFKAWRVLNLLGFLFTFVIGTLWGVLRYTPDQLPGAQAFLILFFLFYVLIALLFASRQPPKLKGYVDGTLVFGVPLVGFGLQAGLVQSHEYGLAISALVVGVFYSLLRVACRRLGGAPYALLSEAYLALALVFVSLSIPFALDGEWVATAWALEGAAILWISLRQHRPLGALFALGLQIGAGVLFYPEVLDRHADWMVLNAVFIGGVFVAVAGLFSSYRLSHANGIALPLPAHYLAIPMLVWGLAWWFANGLAEILYYVDPDLQWVITLSFLATSAAALGWLEWRLKWRALRHTPVGLLTLMVLAAIAALEWLPRPLDQLGWLGWPLLFAAFYGLLWLRDRCHPVAPQVLIGLHLTGALLLITLIGNELVWWTVTLTGPYTDWPVIAQIMVVVPVYWLALRGQRWPFNAHRGVYTVWLGTPLLLALASWTVLSSAVSPGYFAPLPYLPLLNPLDLTQILVLATGYFGCKALCTESDRPVTWQQGLVGLSVLAFLWLNAVLLRTLHHWTGLAWDLEAILASSLAQAAVSVFWTLSGLAVMVLATRRGWRPVWMAAAGLLGIVVAKLFFVDMGDANTLEGIIAFIVVGLLLLVVGYVSPLPPKAPGTPEPTSDQA